MRDNKIISLGKDWYEWEPKWWGSADRERARQTTKALGDRLPLAPPDRSLAGFRLFPEPKLSDADRALRKLGIR